MSKRINTTHGMCYTRIYKIWHGAKSRCHNKNKDSYKWYGAIGIAMCDEWRNDFMEFYNWAIKNGYDDSLSIDRINPNGNYEPLNCRWATKTTQSRNTKTISKNNSSGYKGVVFDKSRNKFIAQITVDYKFKNLGRYNSAIQAAKAYDQYVLDNNLEHTVNGVLNDI